MEDKLYNAQTFNGDDGGDDSDSSDSSDCSDGSDDDDGMHDSDGSNDGWEMKEKVLQKFLHFEGDFEGFFLGKVVKMKEKNKKSSIKYHLKATVVCHGKGRGTLTCYALWTLEEKGSDKTKIKD